MLIRSLAIAALTMTAIVLIHAQVALSGLSDAFHSVGYSTPWWPKLALFMWLIAATQAAVALWGGWRVVHGQANAAARSDLQAALWLICALHIVQGAGAGAVVPADAPFRPAPLSSVIVVLIVTGLLSRGLARLSRSTPSTTTAAEVAPQNATQNSTDDLATDLRTDRSNGTPRDRPDQ
jgi:hypothetical protein